MKLLPLLAAILCVGLQSSYCCKQMPFASNHFYDFVIICPYEWKEAVEPLKEHKEKYGIKTKIVSIDEIYGEKYFKNVGRDEAEKVKYFIKNCIEQWDIKYVLLVGGRKHLKEEWYLPVRYSYLNDRSSSWEYERKFISDLYYADIYDANGNFSSWDTNGNGFYGEYDHEIGNKKFTDEVDLYPDVYVGRLPCRNEKELKDVIKRIIEYENEPCNDFRRVILCGGDLYLHDPWDIAEGEYLLDEIAKKFEGYEIIKLYASYGLNFKKINDEINKGAGFVIFEGAGNHHLWATHEKDNEKWIYYYEWNILQLKNSYLPIVITSGARLGEFNKSRECFNWFFVSKGKAIASIGSTGLCWIGHGKNVSKMFLGKLHLIFCKELAKKKLLGEAWGEAIKEYLKNDAWEGAAKSFHMKAVEEFEIFGDPTLKIGGYERNLEKLQNILHVGGDGENNYSKIQDAIDDAKDGDIIIVHPGIYYEDLCIDKSIEIIGRNAKIKTNKILLIASNIKIENFTIEGYGKGKGLICYGNNCIIEGNEIYFFNKSIFVTGKNCLIRENKIKNNECGIWLNASLNAKIENNEFKSNWFGVWGENACNSDINKNNFSFSEWYALWMEGENGRIEENEFYKNWYSIYLYNSNNFSIRGNIICRNIHGIQFVNSSYNVAERNDIRKNEHYGMYFGWRSIHNEILKNNFIENSQNARDDAGNKWNKNYWHDYVGIKIKIFYLLHFPYYIPKFSFDWHPKIKPYEKI